MVAMQHPEATYKTTAINEEGLEGYSYIDEPHGLDILISNPGEGRPGTNPEQLLGLALATCLNATLEAIEKRSGYEHRSKVAVDVYQTADTAGLKFLVDVTVYIPTDVMGERKAESMFKLAESRCPVAKLLGRNEDVTFRLVDEWPVTE